MSNKNEGKKFVHIVTVMSIIFMIVAMYFIVTSKVQNKPMTGRGAEVDRNSNVSIGGEFELIDQNGSLFTSANLRGKMSLIYFGFAACPDICPTSLEKIAKVVDTLSKYGVDITPVFITLDPKRDSAAVLKNYLQNFDSKFIGLTGSEDAIKKASELFKVYYTVAPGSSIKDTNYLLDHTSLIYLMDKNGLYLKHFHLDSTKEEMVEYIRVNCK